MTDPFVVIGGDAAGLSAASKCRREDGDREVTVFERGAWVSYAHCGTPYYVKGEVEALGDLLSLRPEEVEDRGIDLRRNHEVVAVNADERTVRVSGPEGPLEQRYGDLLVATGARAETATIAGTDLDGAFTMHDMDAAAALRAYLEPGDESIGVDVPYVDGDRVERWADEEPPETAAIVGGGYVGVEMAEALSAYDCEVHLFQRADRPLSPFGESVGERVAETIRAHGVTCHYGASVDSLEGDGRVEAVRYDGEAFVTDLAVVGVGVRPNTDFLEGSAIELGDSDAVAIDEYGRTNHAGIYAAGDCSEMQHAVTGERVWIPLGLTANRAGRAVGWTVAGKPTPVGDVAGTAVVKAFEMECGRTGIIGEADAEAAGFDPVTVSITAASRSGYYPGGDDTEVTLVADAGSGRLIGGAIAGRDRAAIRIDTLATALESDLTVAELERLDLAYAPPFSPVWDPILVAAKVLNGELE